MKIQGAFTDAVAILGGFAIILLGPVNFLLAQAETPAWWEVTYGALVLVPVFDGGAWLLSRRRGRKLAGSLDGDDESSVHQYSPSQLAQRVLPDLAGVGLIGVASFTLITPTVEPWFKAVFLVAVLFPFVDAVRWRMGAETGLFSKIGKGMRHV